MPRRERSVSFGELIIHEHELGVGDNPAVSGGCPVAISDLIVSYQMKVDLFEGLRTEKRRSKPQLLLDRDTRMKM